MFDLVETNMAICRALGLEPEHIAGITIRVRASRVPTVEVEYSVKWLAENPLSEAISRFELVQVAQLANVD